MSISCNWQKKGVLPVFARRWQARSVVVLMDIFKDFIPSEAHIGLPVPCLHTLCIMCPSLHVRISCAWMKWDLYVEAGKLNIWTKHWGLFWFVCLFFIHQVPTASVTIEGASALNRVRWSSGGKEVAVGDSEGRVWIYDTGEVLIIIMHLCSGWYIKQKHTGCLWAEPFLVPRNKCRVSTPLFRCLNHYRIITVTF